MSKSNIQVDILKHPTNTILVEEDIVSKKVYDELSKNRIPINISPPSIFNGKKIWNNLLSKSVDQGTCGSFWAFA